MTDPGDVGTVAENQNRGDQSIDQGEFPADVENGEKSECPREHGVPIAKPRQAQGEDGHDPRRDGSGDGSGNGGQRNHFLLPRDEEVRESGEAEFRPGSQDVGSHVAGNGFSSFKGNIDGPAMADRGGESGEPVIKRGGWVAVAPLEVIRNGRERVDGPKRVNRKGGLDHVEDNDQNADFFAEDTAGIGAPRVMGVIVAGVLMKKDFPDDDSAGDGAE